MIENRETIRFAQKVNPGEKGSLEWTALEACTAEMIYPRFYGQQRLLRVNLFIDCGNEIYDPMIQYVGEQYLSGDDDRMVIDISKPMQKGQKIVCEFENVAPTDTDIAYESASNPSGYKYQYDLEVSVVVDYLGGEHRV